MNVLGLKPRLAEQIIADILQSEMCLETDQIYLTNEDKMIPNDQRLYISVGMIDSQGIGVNDYCVPTDDGMNEIQTVQTRDNIQIDIFSVSDEALFRRWEVLAALGSIIGEQKQESFSFKIFKIPRNFQNTSESEGGSRVKKFSIVIAVFVWYYKQKVLTSPSGDYYDSFGTRVDDEQTIGTDHGIIEFNIPPAE